MYLPTFLKVKKAIWKKYWIYWESERSFLKSKLIYKFNKIKIHIPTNNNERVFISVNFFSHTIWSKLDLVLPNFFVYKTSRYFFFQFDLDFRYKQQVRIGEGTFFHLQLGHFLFVWQPKPLFCISFQSNIMQFDDLVIRVNLSKSWISMFFFFCRFRDKNTQNLQKAKIQHIVNNTISANSY